MEDLCAERDFSGVLEEFLAHNFDTFHAYSFGFEANFEPSYIEVDHLVEIWGEF